MFCTNCGAQLPEGTKYCTRCGARLAGADAPVGGETGVRLDWGPDDSDTGGAAGGGTVTGGAGGTEPPRRRHTGAVVAAVVVVLVLAVGGTLVAGQLLGWFDIPGIVAGITGQGGGEPPEGGEVVGGNGGGTESGGGSAEGGEVVSASGIPVRESVDAYSWDELSQISAEIGAAADAQEAVRIASGYNLCGPNGELASMPSKQIELSNGTVLHARVIGIRHDQRTDGGMAGLTFLFDEVVALNPWNQSGLNDGGWQASSVRSWLSMTFLPTLPQDLQDALVTVNKRTNNTGGVDSGTLDPSVVTVTPDKLWLPSHVELAGNGPEDVHWAVSHYGTQYTWCNDITSDEGTQYELFSEVDAQGFASNPTLVRAYEGQARKWWMRSANPHFTYVSLTVAEDGALDGDVGSIESQGVVPGFCV